MRRIRRIKKFRKKIGRVRRLRQGFVIGVMGLVILPAFLIFALGDRQSLEQTPNAPLVLESGIPIKVLNVENNEVMTLDLEDYLVGVVAAEMPAGFGEEALKAQAVAARTYAYSRLQAAEPGALAPLSTDPATCQAWISAQEQQKRWGNNYLTYSKKIAQAVQATQGELITYQGQPIEPLYHASCGGGRTESSKDVWGGDRPYLVGVSCSHPADKHTQTETSLTLAQLDQALGTHLQAIPASTGGAPQAIYTLATTTSNRTKEILIDGQSFSGSALRAALGLKSTLITYQATKDGITFSTDGYGHGVGMCQYGADYYASQGYSYQQILQHYYTGVDIGQQMLK